ncbi:MAG: hypothetical protein KatS3mg099_083 [Candidatus Parcubacteria bacterium]|nr:MAG: hypothetical protein KatS3mg099_083 [Candidatus Parcubacteria bacterium]
MTLRFSFAPSAAEAASRAARAIAREVNRDTRPTLLLLSGGSALRVVDALGSKAQERDNLTVAMVDDRFSPRSAQNNFAQLAMREAFGSLVRFVDSRPRKKESFAQYAARIRSALLNWLRANKRGGRVVALLGIGHDGHIAGIFPLEKPLFQATYGGRKLVASVELPRGVNPYRRRVSVTPRFLREYVETGVVFADATKHAVLQRLKGAHDAPLWEFPAAVLRTMRNVTIVHSRAP